MKNRVIYSLLIIGIILSFSSCRKSYDPGDWDIIPEQENPPIEKVVKTITLKVMTYYGRTSSNPNNELQQVINDIKEYDPDLLFIRQIDQFTTRAGNLDMPAEFGQALNMEFFFAKAFDHEGGGYGNAVFSKFPIVDASFITMPGDVTLSRKPEVRSLAMITVQIDEKNQLAFAGTEIDQRELTSRVSQISDVLRFTDNIRIPFILAANLNDKPDSQVFDMVKDQFTFGCNTCPANSPKADPTQVLDYITFKEEEDFIIDNYKILPNAVPNVLPMTAEIKMKLQE